ncbi:eukaryotic translation initiation factor 3 subunit A [Boothiomyces sp. JEL0866]|nr:eukaryotic translation initiation factor 3 subunit A [Boothiomyces sp. JEL0866]KAJ3321571.1 eukaryotic translation initiation factor 3 subunit A [Boothiomyces sp. JEL0866]
MAPFQKPENALKRAEELVAVSQHSSALILLHEIILSKRARATPLPTLEPIVLKFIELCVLLGKGKMAREGLFQYKNIAQNTTVATVDLVIKKFLELAKDRLEKAKKKANQINLTNIDDLEAAETPESIMMNTLSNEQSKDRTDRQVVTPWLRFLWEAYRTALDTLRNNARLESVYQEVANEAFAFCLKYDRKTEFRRLCETLRQHISSVAKYAHQPFSIDLNEPETLRRHLETRFNQLNSAAELELWQEGFRSVEDIYNLLEASKKAPKLYMMANYYEKLAKILMVGENYLYHSAAFFKYLSIMGKKTDITQELSSRLASTFLVSALAIPIINSSNVNSEDEKTKNNRLTSLLHVNQVPSRETLLQHALAKNLFSLVSPQIKELYELLEVQFHPLSICQKIAPIIKSFAAKGNEHLSRYVKPLHQVILTRLLQQLSQVYSTIKIETVVKLTAFPAPYNYDAHHIENFVMNGCKRGEFSIRINHQTKSLIFDSNILEASDSCIESKLHSLPLDPMILQLQQFAIRLQQAVGVVNPTASEQIVSSRKSLFEIAAQNIDADRKEVLYRKSLIELKKQKKEEDLANQERLRQQKAIELQAAEAARLAELEKKFAAERLEQQRKEIERAEAQKLAEKIAGELREKNVKIKDDEILDTNKLMELQVQQLEKERRELAIKTKNILKKVDHTERASRLLEIPLLDADYKKQQVQDKEAYDVKVKTLQAAAVEKHRKNMEMKARVSKMLEDYTAHKETLVAARDEHYKILIADAEAKIAAAKAKRIAEHKEKLKKEEQEKEAARIAAEKAAAEKKAREEAAAERQRKLDEQARKQREREAEIEARLASQTQPAAPKVGAWKPSRRAENTGSAPPSAPAQAWRRSDNAPPPRKIPDPTPGRPNPFGSNRPPARDGENRRPGDVPPPRRTDAPPRSSDAPSRPVIGEGKWRQRVAEKKNPQ